MVLPQLTTSDTMLAFQAPPLAVTPPVTQAEKMPGMISLRQRCSPFSPTSSAISRRSEGMVWAPAMALKRMYHWAPSAISRIEPQPIGIWKRTKKRVAKGKMKLAGNEARNCTSGCSSRARRGWKPIATPIGVQIRLASTSSSDTRAKVSSPRRNTVATSARPTRVSTKWSRAASRAPINTSSARLNRRSWPGDAGSSSRSSTGPSRADISRSTPSSTGVEASATRRGMWAVVSRS